MPFPGRAWGLSGKKWKECSRCGFDWPIGMMLRQNGLFVCSGPRTNDCFDEKGAQWYYSKIRWRKNEGYDPDPKGPGDVNY